MQAVNGVSERELSQRKLLSTFLWIGCATSLLVLPGFSHVTVVQLVSWQKLEGLRWF